MSADLWLETDTGGSEKVAVSPSRNVTYNLSPMLRSAGYPGHQQMIGAPASEAGGVFRKVADRLRANPTEFDACLPANGWGDLDWAATFCEEMAADCAAHPRAEIGGWL